MQNWIWPQAPVAEPNARQRFARLLHWTTTASAAAVLVAGMGGGLYWLAIPAKENPIREPYLKDQYLIDPDTQKTVVVPVNEVERAKAQGYSPASSKRIDAMNRELERREQEEQLADVFKKLAICLGVLALAAVIFFAGRGGRYLLAGE